MPLHEITEALILFSCDLLGSAPRKGLTPAHLDRDQLIFVCMVRGRLSRNRHEKCMCVCRKGMRAEIEGRAPEII